MTIASRLSLFLPCCLLLFSIPASADAQIVVRKKPGRTTYSKTASGVTDGNEDDIVTAYSHTNSRGQTYYGIGDDGNGDDIVTAYSHTNSRGQTYYEDSGPDDSRGGNLRGSITVNLVNVKDAPAGSDVGLVGWDVGPVGWDVGPVGSDVGLVGWDVGPVGWDVGPVAIEYAMMASLMGYSDSEAIEYGIVVAIIHEGTGQVISPRDAASGLPTGKR